MCEYRLQDPKTRRWLSLGILLSTISPSLPKFFHPATQFNRNLLDGVSGLLAGLGIGISIMLLYKISRARAARRV
jgi:hypothetical protein